MKRIVDEGVSGPQSHPTFVEVFADGSSIAYVESGPGVVQEVVIQTVPANTTRRYSDGKYFYLGGPGRDLTRRSFVDGTSTLIASRKELGQIQATTLSPDGKWLAYLAGAGTRRATVARPADGGPAIILLEEVAAGYPRIAWTPDSRFIVFFRNPGGLHRVSLEGSPAQALGVEVQGTIFEKSVNADGRRIAFGVSRSDSQLLVWHVVAANKSQRVPQTSRRTQLHPSSIEIFGQAAVGVAVGTANENSAVAGASWTGPGAC